MIDTREFYDSLLSKEMDFFAGVPDSLLANLCACIKENAPDDRNIIAANEGNASSAGAASQAPRTSRSTKNRAR